jgi:hypothetical protein
MPTVLRWRGYRFHFYSDEIGERPHVHVRRDDKMVKIWLDNLVVAVNYGFAQREVNVIRRQVDLRREQLLGAWHAYFGQGR